MSENRNTEYGQSEYGQSEINILELLPQQPPFVMVDKLLHCTYEVTRTSLTVNEENIFFDNGNLSEAGLMENIAQSCAARIGCVNKSIMGDGGVKIGFIGAIRNLEISRLPKAGETIVTQIDTLEEVFNMTLVSATVNIGNEKIASCEMKTSIIN